MGCGVCDSDPSGVCRDAGGRSGGVEEWRREEGGRVIDW